MIVEFDYATHHTGDATGLRVIERSFGDGGDRIIGIIMGSSLLRGVAVSRLALWRGWARAGLSRGLGLGLASTTGGDWGRGRRTSVVAGTVVAGGGRHIAGSLGCELRNRGTRELVGSGGESIDEDTRVVVLVSTRESDKLIGAGGSSLTTTNIDLDAGRVELGTSGLSSQMKGDNLVTEEISTMSEVGRELERMGLSVDCKSSVSDEPKMGKQMTAYIDLVGPKWHYRCVYRPH